ncbi:MAG: L-fucose:H+ symporter permease [Firmicutes bacterium]|nr:L-fucose:H+ symporter permease [Bacillota bacterium]MCM1400717.1 L-fucose:H+ symporter permease [Bacteroides sp.]MCM1476411.1 L-fucose:H+ symporter permease [Bacteroides sp.]
MKPSHSHKQTERTGTEPLVPRRYLLTFILVTSLFALWGFANDITNPMVAAFQTLMDLSATKASLIQFAFYGGYATMAIPAALFVRRFSYKKGILLGLALYAIGAFLFIPAAKWQMFSFFCISLYVLTFGLAFLETTANPFILSLGSRETATRRLNLAQAFNPVGSIAGMAVASLVVLPNLLSDCRNDNGEIIYSTLSEVQKQQVRIHDLAVIRDPYVALGIAVVVIFVIIALTKMPPVRGDGQSIHFGKSIGRLWRNKPYCFGVVAQVFYVGAQIMMWTFIIHYADNIGMNKATAQNYNILAMSLSLTFRFVGTWAMRFIAPSRLLTLFGCMATLTTLGTILLPEGVGLGCLVATSAFMSIMFPSIYGIALENVRPADTSLGAAFLVMAIVGGALMPPLQGSIIDLGTLSNGFPAVKASFALPMLCFAVVTAYGFYSTRNRIPPLQLMQGRCKR